MKKYAIVLMTMLLVMTVLAGCRPNVPQDTTGSIAPTTTVPATSSTVPSSTAPSGTQTGIGDAASQSVQILANIWDQYGEDERFASYGGTVEQAQSDAPGALDMSNTEELTAAYLIPQEQLTAIEEAASLVHMMNSNIFTGVAVKVTESADQKTLQEAWRNAIQQNRWICGQPDRLVMAKVDDGHLLMAFGSTDAMNLFSDKLVAAYAEAEILYDEAIVS